MEPTNEILDLYQRLLLQALEIIRTSDEHQPIFVLDPDGPNRVVLPALFSDERAKIVTVKAVSTMVQTLRPEVIVFIAEAWSYALEKGRQVSNWQEERNRYNSLGDMPGAVELLSISIETHLGMWHWSHRIVHEAGSRSVTLPGELSDQSESRFAFFPENQAPLPMRAN